MKKQKIYKQVKIELKKKKLHQQKGLKCNQKRYKKTKFKKPKIKTKIVSVCSKKNQRILIREKKLKMKIQQNKQKENVQTTQPNVLKRDESKQRLASIMEKIRQKKLQLEINKNQDILINKNDSNVQQDIKEQKKQSMIDKRNVEDKNLKKFIEDQQKIDINKNIKLEQSIQESSEENLNESYNIDNSESKSQNQNDISTEKNKLKISSSSEYEQKVLKMEELDLTNMKDFVLNPPPKGKVIQVSILRDRSGFKNRFYPKYHIFFSENINCHIMSVKKKNTSKSANYIFSLDRNNFNRKSDNCVGTEFFLYDNGENPKKKVSFDRVRNEWAYIKYEKNILGMKGPRKLRVITPQYRDDKYEQFKSLSKSSSLITSSKHFNSKISCFMNNPPQWNEEYEAFVLDFYNRVDKASVKNFQLIEVGDTDHQVLLQFGKIGDHIFNLDFSYPFNLVQAVAVAISSCDNKLLCE